MDDGIFDTLGDAPSLNILIKKINKTRTSTKLVSEQIGRFDGLVESLERRLMDMSDFSPDSESESLVKSMAEEIENLKIIANSAHQATVEVRDFLDNVIDYDWLKAHAVK